MKKWVKVLIVILLVVSFIYDKAITNFIVENRILELNGLMIFIGGWIVYILVAVVSTGLILFNKKQRKYVPVLWFGMLLAYFIALILKNVVARARPELSPLIIPLSEFSFPSGHTVIVFSVLAILQKGFKKISKIWLIAAILVAFSRVYLGVHYVSDVIAGGLLGYFISLISLELEDTYKFSAKILSLIKKEKNKKNNKIKNK